MKSGFVSASAASVLGLASLLILVETYCGCAYPVLSYNVALVLLSSATLYLQVNPTSPFLRLSTLSYCFLLEGYLGVALVAFLPDMPQASMNKVLASALCCMSVYLYLCLEYSASPGTVYQAIQKSVSRPSRSYVRFEDSLPQKSLTNVASMSSMNSFQSAVDSRSEEFFSPLLSSAPDPFAAVPEITLPASMPTGLLLSEKERTTIAELKRRVDLAAELLEYRAFVKEWTDVDWLKLAWSRGLDVDASLGVLATFVRFINDFRIRDIPMSRVRANFSAGFSVLAGTDLQGRVMLWQRMCFMKPSTIPLDVGIKSTWLALDAGLSDEASNRLGVALVYDFSSIGFSNITLRVTDIKNGALACGAAHPSHISRVVFLNAPAIFRIAYSAVKALLPQGVVNIVEFVNSETGRGGDRWFSRLCTEDQLPRYLRDGEAANVDYDMPSDYDTHIYLTWLFGRLQSHKLLYDEVF